MEISNENFPRAQLLVLERVLLFLQLWLEKVLALDVSGARI